MPRRAKGLNRNAGEVCRGPWKASCYITSTDGVNKMEMASFDMIGDEGKGGIQVDSNRTSPSVAQNTCLTTVLIPYCIPRWAATFPAILARATPTDICCRSCWTMVDERLQIRQQP